MPKKKSPAQLEREITAALASPPRRQDSQRTLEVDRDTVLEKIGREHRDYEEKLGALTDKRGKFIVALASAGNIDFDQHPGRSLPGVPEKRVRVASLKDASEACRLYIRRYELGGGNWVGGEVIDAKTKVPVAQISYNGRAWATGEYPQPEILLG
jgi:hypothetical protein